MGSEAAMAPIARARGRNPPAPVSLVRDRCTHREATSPSPAAPGVEPLVIPSDVRRFDGRQEGAASSCPRYGSGKESDGCPG